MREPATPDGINRASCDFCRKMHTSCNGGPVCINCKMRNRVCTFTPRRKPGPKTKRGGGTGGETITVENAPITTATTTTTTAVKTVSASSPISSNSSTALPPPSSSPASSSIPSTSDNGQQRSRSLLEGNYFETGSFFNETLESQDFFSPNVYAQEDYSSMIALPPSSSSSSSSIATNLSSSVFSPYSPSAFSETSFNPPSTPTSKPPYSGSTAGSSASANPSYTSDLIPRTGPQTVSTQPYRAYISCVASLMHDDPLGSFTWLEIPSLDYLMPLGGLTKEGRLKQTLLLCYLSMGALAYRIPAEGWFFAEMAGRNIAEFLDDDWIAGQTDRDFLELLAGVFILLSATNHTIGRHDVADNLGLKTLKLYTTLYEENPTPEPSAIEKWIVSHVQINTKGFGPVEDRIKRIERSLNHGKDPNIRLWIIFGGLWDLFMEAGVRPAKQRDSIQFNWAWNLLSQADDMLAYLTSSEPPVESRMKRSYSAIFMAAKAVLGRFTGCHHSAGIQAAAAAQLLIPLTKLAPGEYIFFGVLIFLSFTAKVLWLSGNIVLWKACDEAMNNAGEVIPGVTAFHQVVGRNTIGDDEPWILIDGDLAQHTAKKLFTDRLSAMFRKDVSMFNCSLPIVGAPCGVRLPPSSTTSSGASYAYPLITIQTVSSPSPSTSTPSPGPTTLPPILPIPTLIPQLQLSTASTSPTRQQQTQQQPQLHSNLKQQYHQPQPQQPQQPQQQQQYAIYHPSFLSSSPSPISSFMETFELSL